MSASTVGKYDASASCVKADMTKALRSWCSAPSRTGSARPPKRVWTCDGIAPARWMSFSSMNFSLASGPAITAVGCPRIFVRNTGP
jgi:hypothetical protein